LRVRGVCACVCGRVRVRVCARDRRAVAAVDAAAIDDINILQATMRAMRSAVAELRTAPDTVLVDGNRRPWGNPAGSTAKGGVRPADPPAPESLRQCLAVIKGDGHVRAIAAASVLAKVHRDRLMMELDRMYPAYGIAQHKGYPVFQHKQAVAKHGPSPCHRLTFKGVKEHVQSF
jgi:ribonuclease HII